MDYRAQLLVMINSLLDGKWSIEDFRENYYDFFLEKIPDDSLTDDDWIFFGEVQEKLDWTNDNIDEEHRRHGWMSNGEYIAWVKKGRDKFLQGKYDL